MRFLEYLSRPPIVLALFAGFFFLRTILMPLAYDDYSYAFIWDGANGGNLHMMITGSPEIESRQRVESFGDIFQSMWSHYFTWGGRIFAHSIVQFFLWLGKPAFDIANTIVFVLLVMTVIKLADVKFTSSRNILLWIFFSLFILTVWPLTNMFWLTGSCNYMWMSLVQLLFLTPYVKALRSNAADDSRLKFFLMIPLGLLAGWSNEAGALTTICLTIFFIAICKARKVFCSWMSAGFVTLLIGCAFMLFAPGNFVRMEFLFPDFKYTSEIFFAHLSGGFWRVVAENLIALLPMFIYFLRRDFGKRLITTEILMLTFAAASFLVPCAMLFSPEFNLRMSITSMVFALVASAAAISELQRLHFDFCKNSLKKISATFIVLFAVYLITLIYVDISAFKATQQQIRFIEQNSKRECIQLPPLPITHRFDKIHDDRTLFFYMEFFGGIETNPKSCRNILTSQYYGVKSIVGVKN